jgi:uncharacterized flavoprotein (TIGR03862 family)
LKKSIAIIGGGASALMLAASLDQNKFDITIYEKNNSLGRKFLVAGDGGFNLTHSENINSFILKYTPNTFLKPSLLAFNNENFRTWLLDIGIETFVGSSNRVYPLKGIKPIQVLNAVLEVVKQKHVQIKSQRTFIGFNEDGCLHFKNETTVKADFVVFALGGASWAKTGSDGQWLNVFKEKGIETKPFQASNCTYKVEWEQVFIKEQAGKPIKNIAITCNAKTINGECVVTSFGLEGGVIYALSSEIRNEYNKSGKALVHIDLKPQLSHEEIVRKMKSSFQKNTTEKIRADIKLSATQIALVKSLLNKEDYLSIDIVSKKIKALPILITGLAPIDEAISTVGGIALEAVDQNFELKAMPNHFVIGEMLDWDAPTGGYLLQACFSMGKHLSDYFNTMKKPII